MIRMQIQLDEQLARLVRAEAKRSGRSVSSIVRDAVSTYASTHDRQALIERALSAVGAGHSGKTDVSENHDDYFAEAIEDWQSS